MRILMFGMSSYPGGIENYIVNYFVNKTVSERNQIDFVTYEPTIAYEYRLSEHGYKVYRVPHLKKNPIGYKREVKKLMRQNQYDCVYVNMLTAANILPLTLAKQCGIPKIVLHAHANSTVQGLVRRTLHNLNKSSCNKAATLRLACSREAGRWIFGDYPFEVIPNAIDCDKFRYNEENRRKYRTAFGISENQIVLGHVGRIAEEKNHVFMLEILRELLKQADAKLVFVGDGYLAQLVKSKVEEWNLYKSVVFYGTTDKTNEVYSMFDYFLFPSTFEGFGMAALEAQSCGLQVFCSDTLSPELNVTGSVKYLNIHDGAAKWAAEILKTIKPNRSELNGMVRDSNYNIGRQIDRLLRLLDEYEYVSSISGNNEAE